MVRTIKVALVLALALPCGFLARAQEKGSWRPASKTAQSVTGPILLGDEKLSINFLTFTIAQIRPLQAAEAAAAFEGAAGGAGHLYRLSIPGDRRFLHKNTLCGAEETQWMVAYVSGKELQVAFFSNATPPVLSAEALTNNTDLCGTYTYVR